MGSAAPLIAKFKSAKTFRISFADFSDQSVDLSPQKKLSNASAHRKKLV